MTKVIGIFLFPLAKKKIESLHHKLSKFERNQISIIVIYRKRSEAATRGVLLKKVLLKALQNSQKNTCAIVSFSIKLQGNPATLLKKGL